MVKSNTKRGCSSRRIMGARIRYRIDAQRQVANVDPGRGNARPSGMSAWWANGDGSETYRTTRSWKKQEEGPHHPVEAFDS